MNNFTKTLVLKTLLLKTLVLALYLFALGTIPTTAIAASKPAPAVGGQRDANGCMIGAGESYSLVRKSCLRLFEAAIRLDPKVKQDGAVLSAFIIFAGEDGIGNVEVFLPNRKTSLVMTLEKGNDAGLWKSKSLKLNYWKGVYSLADAKGKTLYQGPATR